MTHKYQAVYERDSDGRWLVRVPAISGCHTHGRTIEQARERIREALSLFVADADRAEIEDKVSLPVPIQQLVKQTLRARQRLERDQVVLFSTQERAVKALKRRGLSYRDAGQVLDLSHQRVEQIYKKVAG